MFTDFIFNGKPTGQLADAIVGCRFDPGLLRPYFGSDGRRYCSMQTGMVYNNQKNRYEPKYEAFLVEDLQRRGINSPVMNATSLRKEEWLQYDQKVVTAARLRLIAWADLMASNSYGGFNGMGKMILEHETMSDPGKAVVDMDGLTPAQTNDRPKYQLEGLPLPITHSDFSLPLRLLTASRNSQTPLDTTLGETSARRVAEMVEKLTIGVEVGPIYGGNSTQVGGYGRTSQVYGYTNFPNRLTKTNGYAPTGNGRSGTGWVPEDTVKDVLAARTQLYNNKFYGPWIVYHSNDWDEYMDRDYFTLAGTGSVSGLSTKTLRERLMATKGIADVKRLDFLPSSATTYATDPANITVANPFTLLMVQMTGEVARAVNGMDITTVQWESKGGMELNFKVMCIYVPQLRADFNGNCGMLHMTCSN